MRRLREPNGNGDIIHADGAGGDGRTLCGYAYEGSCTGDDVGVVPTDRGKINCADCIQIIEFCRGVTHRSLVPKGQRRSPIR